MSLINDFFYIREWDLQEGKAIAGLEINPAHAIFAGHFPGQPVVPGVCMFQMIKEILTKALAKQIRLKKADNFKFLSIIDPTKNNLVRAELKYTIAEEGIVVFASLASEATTYFKMNAVFCLDCLSVAAN